MKKILVVEDDPMFSEIYVTKLAEEGYAVTLAADGDDALKKVRASLPDIVLLDLLLPKMSGIEVLRHLRADGDEGVRQLPVIVVTNVSRDVFVEALRDLDVKEYFLKSDVIFSQVSAKIREVVGE